jgi:predicted MFS family arabinose efflux permease
MAVYGAMSALGITIGVLLGGVLTGLLSWRWVFFINIPIGLAVLAASGVLIKGERHSSKLDTPGALSGTGAVVALTYGITHAGEHGWSNLVTVAVLNVAFALAVTFVVLEARRADPMLPLGLFRDRNRSGSYATMLFIGAGLMGTFYLLTLYLQQVLLFSPLWSCPLAPGSSSGQLSAPSWSSALRRASWPVQGCWWRRPAWLGSQRSRWPRRMPCTSCPRCSSPR